MNDYIRAITYNHPERIPVHVSLLPATWARYGKELQRLCLHHPDLFENVQATDEQQVILFLEKVCKKPATRRSGKFP